MHVDQMPGVAKQDLGRCVHCGFCLPTCPTYQLFGVEMDSPRGRIIQIEAAKRGAIPLQSESLRTHLSLCLACRACETACPSGVAYGRIIEGARAALPPSGGWQGVVQNAVLRGVFTRPALLAAAGLGLRLYQRSGLESGVRALGLPGRLGEMERLLPRAQGRVWQGPLPTRYEARGPRTLRVALVRGCVMQQFFARTNEATARVLAENGCEVVAPPVSGCCGALHVHAGDRETARHLARRNIDTFLALDPDVIVINAAGCGSTLKEYGELLADDPIYAERAAIFAGKMRDVSEVLAALPLRSPRAALAQRVTYQDACHLAHAQRVRAQPRAVLAAIPGLELVELRGSDNCCGSAGIYNLTQPDAAQALLERKMDAVAETGADILVVANPGCAIQIAAGIRQRRLRMRVAHPVDLLDRAYAAERGFLARH
jgi:glycolate oxidase iron-sulfur subunit